jgi:hypothetical protein
MDTIEIYASGILYCSVCAPKRLAVRTVERVVNELNPTLITTKWKVSKDKTFKTGETNPCICENYPDRLHYLMECRP